MNEIDRLNGNINAGSNSGKKVLVVIGPSRDSESLIHAAENNASLTGREWIAVNVELGWRIKENDKKIILNNCNLARELGAEVITTSDTDIVKALLRVANENNVEEIIINKHGKRKFGGRDRIERLVKESNNISVLVVDGENKEEPAESWRDYLGFRSGLTSYFIAMIIVYLVGLGCYSIYNQIGYQTVSLLLLLTVALLPLFNFGPGPTFLAALLSALTWNYFFIPPQYTFHIYKVEDVLMFIMYFIVASVTGTLTARIRSQEIFVRQREKRTNALYSLTKDLSGASGRDKVAQAAVKNIKQYFEVDVVLIFPDKNNMLVQGVHPSSSLKIDDVEWRIAQWTFLNGQKAGRFSETLPLSDATYYPLKSARYTLGVLGIKSIDDLPLSFDQQALLETFIAQITTTLEKEYLSEVAKQSLLYSESEKLYKTLFNSISHELKTPITTIISAASSFNNENILKQVDLVKGLSNEIGVAAERLKRLVENLLDIARLESGVLKLKTDWHDISDLIYGVMNRLKNELADHKLVINIQKGIKYFKFDYGLLEQSLINILHNSITYTEDGSEIYIDIKEEEDTCIILIADNGQGFASESIPRLFEKFYRAPHSKSGGTGIGLSIAKGFVEAHGGSITAQNRKGGGAEIIIKLPMEKSF